MKNLTILVIIVLTLTSCGMLKYDANGGLIKRNGSTHCGTFK